MRDTVAVTNPCIVGDLDADIVEDDDGYADSEGSVEYGDAEQLELDLLELGWSLSDQDGDEDTDRDAPSEAPLTSAAAAATADSDTDRSEGEGPANGSDDEGDVSGSGSAPGEDTFAPETSNPSSFPPADVTSSSHYGRLCSARANLVVTARKKEGGFDYMAAFVRGFVEKAAELRDHNGGAFSDRHDGVRQTFLAELLSRHVRPLSARAPLIDGLTALSNMPARRNTFAGSLTSLRVNTDCAIMRWRSASRPYIE